MYLSYNEYLQMGGTLDSIAFPAAERKAERCINSQAGGKAGQRIKTLGDIPQGIKDCVFEVMRFAQENDGTRITGENQSQDGVSESYSYAVRTDEEVKAEQESIIEETLYGSGLGYILYRGACI